jgi:D-sedoheptulose 7-phosphate isomerase
LTGNRSSRLESAADVGVRVQVDDSALVQEMHMMITHLLCGIAEAELCRDQAGG